MAHADLAVLEPDDEAARLGAAERRANGVRELADGAVTVRLDFVDDRVGPQVARDLEERRTDVASVFVHDQDHVLSAHDAESAFNHAPRGVREVVVDRGKAERRERDAPRRTHRRTHARRNPGARQRRCA